ncbi:MAG: DUF1028 domain-containing protein [Gemmatimonadota bacterium]|nr:DUF1028 domain-containing protein [Gemmatimonadota bacterium]
MTSRTETATTTLAALAIVTGALATPGPASAQSPPQGVEAAAERRPVATYSIVARDPATGELGVAVQSHWFSVGPIVPWAEAGVGAVATQSFVDPSYGPLGLELMKGGKTASRALAALLEADENPEVRQVAMVDFEGDVAAHTGENAIIAAGHHVGENYSVQANLMESPAVWPAMAEAFERAEGDLAERMLVALEAAQAEGGDIRGRQSAALLVVDGDPTGKPWVDRIYDLRVEDHPEPLVELRRLLHLARAYREMNAGDEAMTVNDVPAAVEHYDAAAEAAPEIAEMVYWAGITLASVGKVDQALPRLEEAYAADPRWAVLTARLPEAGLLPDDAELLARLLAIDGGEPGMEEWRRLAEQGNAPTPVGGGSE